MVDESKKKSLSVILCGRQIDKLHVNRFHIGQSYIFVNVCLFIKWKKVLNRRWIFFPKNLAICVLNGLGNVWFVSKKISDIYFVAKHLLTISF